MLTGIGKSGHVANKIAATLSSTGTPAFFLHPAEAGHGDLGMVTNQDTLVAISYSGSASELDLVINHARREKIRLISITGNPESTLAKAADATIVVTVQGEACPHGLAPTISTTATMAVGDALAMALVNAKGFSPEDFAKTHPDGALGRRLLTSIADIMYTGDALPKVQPETTLANTIMEMSTKRLGMTLIVQNDNQLAGIFTDGDLRRTLERTSDINTETVSKHMCTTPKIITPTKLASEALAMMEEHTITHLPVIEDEKLVGLIDIHSLMKNKIT